MSKAEKSDHYKEGWRSVFDHIEAEVRSAEHMLNDAHMAADQRLTPNLRDHYRGRRDAGIAACKSLSGKIRSWTEEVTNG